MCLREWSFVVPITTISSQKQLSDDSKLLARHLDNFCFQVPASKVDAASTIGAMGRTTLTKPLVFRLGYA